MAEGLVGVREAAEDFGCLTNTVYRLQKDQKLSIKKRLGKQIYFDRADVIALIGKWRVADSDPGEKILIHPNGLTEKPAKSVDDDKDWHYLEEDEEEPVPVLVLGSPAAIDPMARIQDAVRQMAEVEMRDAKRELVDAVEMLEVYISDISDRLAKLKESLEA